MFSCCGKSKNASSSGVDTTESGRISEPDYNPPSPPSKAKSKSSSPSPNQKTSEHSTASTVKLSKSRSHLSVKSSGEFTNLHIPNFRKQLPNYRLVKDFNIWTILKSAFGKDLTKISMPVILNEPLSFIQRTAEYLEYEELLKAAVSANNSVKRLEYIVAFIVSGMSSNEERTTKPFNPLLGETFEYIRSDLGYRFLGEQVAHHPPITAFHVDGPGYIFYGSIEPRIKFWGRSVEIVPKGWMHLKIIRLSESYSWQYPNLALSNLLGPFNLDISGKMTVLRGNSKAKALVTFKACDWSEHFVEGFIFDENGVKKKVVYGSWPDGLNSCNADDYEKFLQSGPKMKHYKAVGNPNTLALSFNDIPFDNLWRVKPRPFDSKQMYDFTEFSLTLNEMNPYVIDPKGLAPTDSRYRPDIRLLEHADLDQASAEKDRLELKQREARKHGDSKALKPRWFTIHTHPDTLEEEWMSNGKYWNRQWTECPNLF